MYKLLKYFFIFCVTISSINGYAALQPLSTKQVEMIIKQSHFNPEFQISAQPEIVKELNTIRQTRYRRLFLQASLARMKQYQSILQAELKKRHLPQELLAIPILETGYRVIPTWKNARRPAGIWQLVPRTARTFGLIVNSSRDDRLNVKLSTATSLAYLNKMHQKFHNWILAVMAYEYGERKVSYLVRKVGSKNIWVLARSRFAPKNFKRILTLFQADAIVMENPSIISS